MKKILFCPLCRKVVVGDETWRNCYCGASLIPTTILEDDWKRYPEEQKNRVLAELESLPIDQSQYLKQQNKTLKGIASELHTLYVITLIGLILSVVSMFVSFFFYV